MIDCPYCHPENNDFNNVCYQLDADDIRDAKNDAKISWDPEEMYYYGFKKVYWSGADIPVKMRPYTDEIDNVANIIRTDKGYFLAIEDESDYFIPIKFCPICGAKLL